MSLFSIITICYNSEKTIEQTINSVLMQTNQDYEYIIVDGASTDNTLNIIKEYEPLFKGRMKWRSEPDTGIYNAMNKGIRMSKGELVGIVNSDDWLEPDALESVVNSIIAKGLSIDTPLLVTGWIKYHYSDGSSVIMKTDNERYEYYARKLRMGINHPATFVSLATYRIIGLFDENYKLYGDADFVVRCFRSSINVCFVDKVISNMSDGGASSSVSRKGLHDSFYRINKFYPNNLYKRLVNKTSVLLFYIQSLVVPPSVVRILRKARNK